MIHSGLFLQTGIYFMASTPPLFFSPWRKKNVPVNAPDRFIPRRDPEQQAFAQAKLAGQFEGKATLYKDWCSSLLNAGSFEEAQRRPILAFSPPPPKSRLADIEAASLTPITAPRLSERTKYHLTHQRLHRNLRLVSGQVLDAPELRNDYYSHPLCYDQNDVLFVALEGAVYYQNAQKQVGCVIAPPKSDATAVAEEKYISALSMLGLKGSEATNKLIYTASDHTTGIVSYAEAPRLVYKQALPHLDKAAIAARDNTTFYVGNAKGTITLQDMRSVASSAQTWTTPCEQIICNLSYDNSRYLAVGSNDNKVYVYDARQTSEPFTIFKKHNAAVRALAFSHHGEELLSGGGTACTQLYLWRVKSGEIVASKKVGSQLCSVNWLPDSYNYFIATLGYDSTNKLNLWYLDRSARKINLVKKVYKAKSDVRCLDAVIGPKSENIVTIASDENIRFFKLEGRKKPQTPKWPAMSSVLMPTIR